MAAGERPSSLALRRLTIRGEEVLEEAAAEARLLLRGHDDPVIRSYAAAGLLAAVLDELNSGVPRMVAAETLKEALAELEALPS